MAGRRTFFFEGLGVSEGIAIGPAYLLETDAFRTESYELDEPDVEREVERFNEAVGLAREEVSFLGKTVAERIDHQQAAIFDAHLMMLDDPMLIERAIEKIRSDRRNAESVLWDITSTLVAQMQAIGDQYFSERNHDLYDVSRRVIKFLGNLKKSETESMPREGCIVVAPNLGPAETAQLSRDHILGFCTNEGGFTSHASILAKALSIPAVVGLEFITHYIRTGDILILDGREGKVILHPSRQQIRYYENKKAEYAELRVSLDEMRDLPAETTDGVRISMFANIELPEEMDLVERQAAEGIGLYRTEYIYLDRRELPEEEDHYTEYKKVFDRMKGRPVTVRTLDLGGDKLPTSTREMILPENNPFMGMRAIRLCMARPELFRKQLRAMLRAAAGREISIMIPMVSNLTEIRATRRMLDGLINQFEREGTELPTSVKLGAMIEIPAAVLLADAICAETDFLSIGTNDLVQYTLAVDRVNKAVANIYRETHPAVLQLIRMTVDSGRRNATPVSVCGEMASDVRLALLLIGIGVRCLSMGSASIPLIKRVVRAVSISEVETLAQESLTATTAEEVEHILDRALKPLFSDLRIPTRTFRDKDTHSERPLPNSA